MKSWIMNFGSEPDPITWDSVFPPLLYGMNIYRARAVSRRKTSKHRYVSYTLFDLQGPGMVKHAQAILLRSICMGSRFHNLKYLPMSIPNLGNSGPARFTLEWWLGAHLGITSPLISSRQIVHFKQWWSLKALFWCLGACAWTKG
jgi:hypothetical protein